MGRPTLTLGIPTSSESSTKDTGIIVKQKFNHGRTRAVTVIVNGEGARTPGSADGQIAEDDADLMSSIVRATLVEPTTPQAQLGPVVKEHLRRDAQQRTSKKSERNEERQALRALAKAQAKAQKQLVSKQRKQTRLQNAQRQNPPQVRRDIKPEIALAERKKDRVAQLSLQFTRGKLPDLKQARDDLEYLRKIDIIAWDQRDRDRYSFVAKILTSIVEGKAPQHIVQPDGKYFRWPGTDIGNRSSHESAVAATQEVGVLKSIGYQVGLQGLPLHERRRLLSRVFEHELTMALSKSYLSEWGRPGSSLRLRKLAHTIASLTRNMKRRNSDAPSIEDWEADLAYLKQRYYIGRYDFPWPRA
jgi:hypothetical protein